MEHKKLREMAQKSLNIIDETIERLVPASPVATSTGLPPPLRPFQEWLDSMRPSEAPAVVPTDLPPLRPLHSQTMAAAGQPSEPAAGPEPSAGELPPVPEGVYPPMWLLACAAEVARRELLSPPDTTPPESPDADSETSSEGTESASSVAPETPPTVPSRPAACLPPMSVPSPSAPSQPAAPAEEQTAESAPVVPMPSEPMACHPPTAAPVPPRRALPASTRPTVQIASRGRKPAAPAAPPREKTISGRVTKPAPKPAPKPDPKSDPSGQGRDKTVWERTKGELLAEEQYGRDAETRCTHCSRGAGGKACRVAVDPLWYGSFKCRGCIRSKLGCSHNSLEKTKAAKLAAAGARHPKVAEVIEARILVERPPPASPAGASPAGSPAASPAASTTPAAATPAAEAPAEAPTEAPTEPEA
ncbi:hypothetical protein LQW54_005156 [Pestalotiopsis sp. IQ-011]